MKKDQEEGSSHRADSWAGFLSIPHWQHKGVGGPPISNSSFRQPLGSPFLCFLQRHSGNSHQSHTTWSITLDSPRVASLSLYWALQEHGPHTMSLGRNPGPWPPDTLLSSFASCLKLPRTLAHVPSSPRLPRAPLRMESTASPSGSQTSCWFSDPHRHLCPWQQQHSSLPTSAVLSHPSLKREQKLLALTEPQTSRAHS